MKNNDKKIWNDCLNLIPKGTMTASKSFKHLFGIEPFFTKKAKGSYLYTTKNEKFLDYCCALGPIILGYNHSKVNRAIKKQLKKGISFSAPTKLEYKLAKKINEIIPNAEKIRFCKNGSDATQVAVRIANAFTGKKHIATFGYHGFNDFSAISLIEKGIPFWKKYVHEFKYNDINSLENILKKYQCSCIIMEPVSLEEPEDDFLQKVRELTTKYNALLIFDEVVTGFRFDFQGCQKIYGVDADLICLGKAMANGMPISVICGKEKYMSLLEKDVMFSLTFGGEALSLASSLATLNELENEDYEKLKKLGSKLRNEIIDLGLKHKLFLDFKGNAFRGYLNFDNKIYLNSDELKSKFNRYMFNNNVFMPNVIYLNFSHTEKQINYTLKCVDKAFKKIKNEKTPCIK